MKKSLSLLLLIYTLLFYACGEPVGSIGQAIRAATLAPYGGQTSMQISLINKIDVRFDTSFYYRDVLRGNEKGRYSFVTDRWEHDNVSFFYLNKDSTAIATHLNYALLAALSKSRVRDKLDSLHVYVTETEVIVPYHRSGRVEEQAPNLLGGDNFIGPSRVRLQVVYQCFHGDLVTENAKSWQRSASSHHAGNSKGDGGSMIDVHVTAIYAVLGELLTQAAGEIRGELEGEL